MKTKYTIIRHIQKSILLCAIIYYPSLLLGQKSPDIEWQRCLGGSLNENIQSERSITQTRDGGYLIAGSTYSNDGDIHQRLGDATNKTNSDFWVVKLGANGDTEWTKSLGGSKQDIANCIIQSTDGGYVVAGFAYSNDNNVSGNHGDADGWIVKLDSTGNIKWQRSVGGANTDIVYSIIQTSDSGYIAAGYTNSNEEGLFNHGSLDVFVVKLNSSGYGIWQKCFGGTGEDIAYSIVQTSDNGYAFAGSTTTHNDGDVSGYHIDSTSSGSKDYWVARIDSVGNLLWQKCLGGTRSDFARSICKTTSNGFIVCGTATSNDGDVSGNHGGTDAWVIKLDSLGGIDWEKCYGGTGVDQASSIINISDGGYVVSASSSSQDGDVSGYHRNPDTLVNSLADVWVFKLNTSGVMQWQKCLGGINQDQGFSIIQTNDEGYAVLGTSNSNDDDVSENHGLTDLWVVKLKPEKNVVENTVTDQVSLFPIYPNPSSDQVHILLSNTQQISQLEVYDLIGRKLNLPTVISGNAAIIQVNAIPANEYIIRVNFIYKYFAGIYTVPFIVRR